MINEFAVCSLIVETTKARSAGMEDPSCGLNYQAEEFLSFLAAKPFCDLEVLNAFRILQRAEVDAIAKTEGAQVNKEALESRLDFIHMVRSEQTRFEGCVESGGELEGAIGLVYSYLIHNRKNMTNKEFNTGIQRLSSELYHSDAISFEELRSCLIDSIDSEESQEPTTERNGYIFACRMALQYLESIFSRG